MNWILYWSVSAIIFLSCGSADHTHDPGEKFESKYVRLANDTNHLMMIENVIVHFGDLSAEADSAFYEKPEKTITLYSVRRLTFRGKEMQAAPRQSVTYTKGDKELRIK